MPKQAVRDSVGHLCGNAVNQMASLTLNALISIRSDVHGMDTSRYVWLGR
jgi:hypothetical protein